MLPDSRMVGSCGGRSRRELRPDDVVVGESSLFRTFGRNGGASSFLMALASAARSGIRARLSLQLLAIAQQAAGADAVRHRRVPFVSSRRAAQRQR
jgi:hypothetical protein